MRTIASWERWLIGFVILISDRTTRRNLRPPFRAAAEGRLLHCRWLSF